jgi:predicted transcriptional regulator
MQRTTISLPDNVAAALNREARRRRIPVSQVAREAIEARLGLQTGATRKLPFAALGRSGHRTTARDAEEILAREWGVDRDR